MTQCMGDTQKGERCKRNAVEGSDYCNAHAYQAGSEAQWKHAKPEDEGGAGAEAKARTEAKQEQTASDCGDAWTWVESWKIEGDAMKWAAVGLGAALAMLLLRRR